jgi:Holliday junction DNA helicase RuvA
MIGLLRGTLLAKKAPSLLLDVRGVGYEVDAPMSTFFKLPEVGAEVVLHTHLIVREDAHALYGFLSEDERSLFRTLIRISGIGAKLALCILSGMSADEFNRCIQQQDTARLVRLPGVGKRTAERLIVELRGRLTDVQSVPGAVVDVASALAETPVQDAIAALVALGFKPPEASILVRKIPAEGKASEDLIRLALQAAAK